MPPLGGARQWRSAPDGIFQVGIHGTVFQQKLDDRTVSPLGGPPQRRSTIAICSIRTLPMSKEIAGCAAHTKIRRQVKTCHLLGDPLAVTGVGWEPLSSHKRLARRLHLLPAVEKVYQFLAQRGGLVRVVSPVLRGVVVEPMHPESILELVVRPARAGSEDVEGEICHADQGDFGLGVWKPMPLGSLEVFLRCVVYQPDGIGFSIYRHQTGTYGLHDFIGEEEIPIQPGYIAPNSEGMLQLGRGYGPSGMNNPRQYPLRKFSVSLSLTLDPLDGLFIGLVQSFCSPGQVL